MARFLRPPFPPLGRPAAIEAIRFIVNVCTDGEKSHFPLFLAISHAVLTRLEYNDITIHGHAHKYRCRPPAFAIEELLARIRALFRRVHSEADGQVLAFKDLVVDTQARTVKKGDEFIELTKREYDLLVAFMQNINVVLTRDVLLDKVWGFDAEVETNVVDVYVRYLRQKLDEHDKERYIQTVRGAGYVMRP